MLVVYRLLSVKDMQISHVMDMQTSHMHFVTAVVADHVVTVKCQSGQMPVSQSHLP